MTMELSDKEFRRLLDLVYVGNWVMNSLRGSQRIKDYDDVESKCFSYCLKTGMFSLFEMMDGEVIPSASFEDGGIQEAIMDYEDAIFYDILAEELARRDMDFAPIDNSNDGELSRRIDEYMEEFEENGLNNVSVNKERVISAASRKQPLPGGFPYLPVLVRGAAKWYNPHIINNSEKGRSPE